MDTELPDVVVVDDNAVMLKYFEHATKNLALELHMFKSANAVLPFLMENKPQLLFLDIIMPEKDGLTLLQELRRIPLHLDTLVIMITSKDYVQDRTVAKKLGAVEFLTKPMPMVAITDIILKYINKDNPY